MTGLISSTVCDLVDDVSGARTALDITVMPLTDSYSNQRLLSQSTAAPHTGNTNERSGVGLGFIHHSVHGILLRRLEYPSLALWP